MAKQLDGKYMEVDGLRTFYLKAGSGYPLILIHGASPGACSLVSWKLNIEPLAAAGFAVYAFDQPGFGTTDNPPDFSADYRVKHAKLFIDKMKLDHCHMIANSQGAYIAARIALEDQRVERLVFTATGTLAPKGSAPSEALAREHAKELSEYFPSLENMRAMTMRTLFNKDLVTEELVQLRYAASTGKNFVAQQKRREASGPKPLPEELRNLKAKTLLLWGKNDSGVALERGFLLFQLLPDAELHIFDKCGHWVQWDQASRFHGVVVDFLRS